MKYATSVQIYQNASYSDRCDNKCFYWQCDRYVVSVVNYRKKIYYDS